KVAGLSVIVLWSERFQQCIDFYKALGLPLEEEDHGDGPVHYACEIGTAHFAIFPGKPGSAVARGNGGGTQIGFQVSSVDECFMVAKKLGASVVWEPKDMPWGRAALVCDPDGRPVELNQAN